MGGTIQYSTVLFAEPSFLEGLARLLDLGGTMTEFNGSPNGEIADVLALTADWRAVGDDLRQAIALAKAELAAADVR